MEKVQKILEESDGISDVFSASGYNIINGVAASNCGFAVAILKPWKERRSAEQHQFEIVKHLYGKLGAIPEAAVIPFNLPSVPGIGSTEASRLCWRIARKRSAASPVGGQRDRRRSEQVPETSGGLLDLPRHSAAALSGNRPGKGFENGGSASEINSALQSLFGYRYINDFNRFGKNFKVEVQAQSKYRDGVDDIPNLHIKSASGEMVPLGAFTAIENKFVPQYLSRYNMYSAATIRVLPPPESAPAIRISIASRNGPCHSE